MKEKTKTLETILKENGFLIYSFQGISMLPLLVMGKDTVRIEPIKEPINKNIEIYDVVLYKSSTTGYTLHRVIEQKNKNNYLIVGDNCNKGEIVHKSRIIGKMVAYFKQKDLYSIESDEYQEYLKKYIINVDYQTRTLIAPAIPLEWILLLKLVRCAIKNDRLDFQNEQDIIAKDYHVKDINWASLYQLAKHHSVTALIANVIDKDFCDSKIYESFMNDYNNNIRKQIMFDNERKKLMEEFDKQGIDYCFLKGIITTPMYPKIGLREFADNDILMRDEDSKKVYEMMTNRGYKAAALHGVHDSYHLDPFYNFEFHRNLFNEDFCFHKYYNDIWSRVKKKMEDPNNHEYLLSDEDFYMHHYAHFYKHFSHGGAGVRSFVDTYIIREKIFRKEGFNYEFVHEMLEKNKLIEFENNINDKVDLIFKNPDALTYQDLVYMMESGTYGIKRNHVNNELDKKKGNKVAYMFGRIFLPYRTMKTIYPVLIYVPILLPFCYIARMAKPIFNKEAKERTKQELEIMKVYQEEKK